MSRAALAGALALLAAGCGGEDQEPPAAVGGISCSSTALKVTPRVQTRPDGIHLDVKVRRQRGVSLTIDGRRVRGRVVLNLAPGPHRVRCHHSGGGSLGMSFEVVKPTAAPY